MGRLLLGRGDPRVRIGQQRSIEMNYTRQVYSFSRFQKREAETKKTELYSTLYSP